MAMTELSTLLPLMSVPRCPQALQLLALRLASRRFCEDTGMWTEDLTSFDTEADEADYELASDYDNVSIRRATKVTVDDVEMTEDTWELSASGVLTFDPAPTITELDVVVTVVYVPDVTCVEVVDWLITRWGEAIAAGAEAHLKREPGNTNDPNPWYDATSAAVAERRYQDGVGAAKLEIISARQSGQLGVEFPVF